MPVGVALTSFSPREPVKDAASDEFIRDGRKAASLAPKQKGRSAAPR